MSPPTRVGRARIAMTALGYPPRVSMLIAFPSRREAQVGAGLPVETLRCGVGKTPTAISLVQRLERGPHPSIIVLAGVCGAYPSRHLAPGMACVSLGSVCIVDADGLEDEGVESPEGFLSLSQLGLEGDETIAGDLGQGRAASELLGCRVVRGATVSTCSGTEALSRARAGRTTALVETMEGASAGAVCRRYGIPWVQLRSVSNWTGDRTRAAWCLEEALDSLGAALKQLHLAGWGAQP